MAEYVEFKVMTHKQTTIQEGFVDMSTINDEEPLIKFYDEYGVETFQPRKNPYQFHDPKFQVWEDTMMAWIVDEFYPDIIKYQDENKTLQQEGYVLIINEGEK